MMDARNTFEAAAMPYLENLYRTALRMVHDEEAAVRSIEQTFLEARSQAHHISEVTDWRVWMFSILFRKLRFHPAGTVSRAAEPDQDEILGALDGIPAVFREVLLLADVEGFGKPELEAILQVPAELVATRLAEGRARLRHALQYGALPYPQPTGTPAIAQGEL
ncbi:MAG TPA: hypothetical protein VKU19_00085 [Bryobacteraceae bacterium]|nr:hypothetical protein [Bryobacteraceae bacterium]